MTHSWRRFAAILPLFAVFALTLLLGQEPTPERLPSGKLQRDEILKAEHEQNLKDAARLVELSQQLQVDIEKNDRFVLSLSTLKKTDDIEKLVKKIRSRLRR